MMAAGPAACPVCGRADRLVEGAVREGVSGGRTLLCPRCEVLVVVTTHNLRRVELTAAGDADVMLKEPHLIRRVVC